MYIHIYYAVLVPMFNDIIAVPHHAKETKIEREGLNASVTALQLLISPSLGFLQVYAGGYYYSGWMDGWR